MPGCALCSHSPLLIEKIYTHLALHLPGIALLQHCCATPIRSINNATLFPSFYSKLEEELTQHNITTVITACENCYMTIKKYSPKITVQSIYTVLNTLPLESKDYSSMPKAALHDPCPTRKESEIHESVRELLKKIAYPFEEFTLNKDTTICCGSGQMQPILNPKKALAIAQKRCSQTSCEYIISYCQSCVSMLGKGGKHCFHLLELLFTQNITTHIEQHKQSMIKGWFNRYKVKRMTVVKEKNM